MTLDEAIKNAEAVAEINQIIADAADGDKWSSASFESCAVKHRQFAEWLRELKKRREKDVPDMNVGDLISRQAAIDAMNDLPKYFDKTDTLCLDYADVMAVLSEHLPAAQPKSEERTAESAQNVPNGELISKKAAIDATWEEPTYTDPINVLTEVRDRIKALPSAQPEIIRCKDCEYGEQDEVGRWFCRSLGCQIGNEDGNGYCSDAERRTNGRD